MSRPKKVYKGLHRQTFLHGKIGDFDFLNETVEVVEKVIYKKTHNIDVGDLSSLPSQYQPSLEVLLIHTQN